MPIVIRLMLAVAVVALGVGVLYVGAGGLSRVAGAVSTSFGGFVDELVATPVPSATDVPISDAPLLEPPAEPYTAEAEVDLLVTVPAALVGDDAPGAISALREFQAHAEKMVHILEPQRHHGLKLVTTA